MNPIEHPVYRALQRRLLMWEFLLGVAGLGLFWMVSYMKGYELGAVTTVGLALLALCIVYPRGGFYFVILLVYAESLFGAFNQVSIISRNFDIMGFEPIVESAFFYLIFPGVVVAVILGYAISRFVSNPAPFGMLTTEYIMLIPPLLCLTFLPLSFYLEHDKLPMIADCLPGLFFILGIIASRVFQPLKGKYFLIMNILCIGNHIIGVGFLIYTIATGLVLQNPAFVVWCGRILMGPTDYNIFLVPLTLCVIMYLGDKIPRGWLLFYHFSFWAFFLRLVVALYRGPIFSMFLAIAIVYLLSQPNIRAKMRRHFVNMLITLTVIVLVIIFFVPFGGMMLQSIFVERFTGIFQEGEEHDASKLSLEYRLQETGVVWDEIKEYPIFGHGPGAELEFRTSVRQDAEKRAFIHNGYLWLWHKFGILGPISIVLFLFAPFIRGWQLRHKNLTTEERAYLIGIMATTICIFPAIVTNSIIARPQGLLMLITCFMWLLNIERRVFKDEGLPIEPYL